MPASADPLILIVDDDVAHAASVRDLLAAHQYPAATISDPTGVLAALGSGDYHVLLLDLNMPELTGIEVLEQIQQAGVNIKTIVLSGESKLSTVTPILRLGAHDYLAKPYEPQQLLTSVENALLQARLERDNATMAREAEANQALHAFLLNASPDLIYMLDDQGRFRFLNSRLQDVFGFAVDDMLDEPWQRLVGDGLTATLDHRFNERRTGERATRNLEFEFETRSGDRRTFEFSATGLYDEADREHPRRFAGTYGVLRDVTEARRAEKDRLLLQNQLQQASKMEAIGQLAGGIAHDFNNILASIIGYAELVLSARERLDTSQVDNYLGEVVSAGHRARDLISQMLTFTRANRGDPCPVDIREAITDVSRMLRAAIPTTIDIDTSFTDDLADVMADPVQLQQIIINLLINARDAIEGNGRIEILAGRGRQEQVCVCCGERLAEEHIVLAVTDTGHGISPDDQAKIFEMYFTTREHGKGTGIGLWLIDSLVHEYGGHITLESEVGVGTTFYIHLPIAGAEKPVEESAPVIAEALGGRVVVVDDEVSVSNFIGEVLRDHGYDVAVFNESPTALRYLEAHMSEVGMLLTDQMMPLVTGLELSERAKALKPGLPIILITAYTATADSRRLEEIGVNRFLSKPFRIDELLAAIRELSAPASTQAEALSS